MNSLAAEIEKNISAKKLFRDGQRILVAVSGGVDSMVLLDLLAKLGRGHRWKLTVAHFNHQLRGAAGDADEKMVRHTARKLKLPFIGGRGDVRNLAQKEGLSLEMAARKLRHDFLAHSAGALKISTVALAHHADDQVELFFLRLLRGTGGEGLAGMKWSGPSPGGARIRLTRPLLNQTKAALREFAVNNKIPFSEDASNTAPDMRRNRLRHQLIPALRRDYQPALDEIVLRLMEIVGEETEFVQKSAHAWMTEKSPAPFDSLPIALQRAVLRRQLLAFQLSPDFELVERLRKNPDRPFSVNEQHSVSRNLSGKVELRRLSRVAFSGRSRKVLLAAPKGRLKFGGVELTWQVSRQSGHPGQTRPNVEYFDADKVGAKIWLRCWQPGDRFQPIGMRSPQKLQDLFTNLKVNRDQRRQRVVAVTSQGELFWVEGLRMAEKFKLEDSTVRRLKWQCIR